MAGLDAYGVVGALLYVALFIVHSVFAVQFISAGARDLPVAIYIVFFGTFAGAAMGLLVGFPALVLLGALERNGPLAAGACGCLLATLAAATLLPKGANPWIWPPMAAAIGLACGAIASGIARLHHSLQDGHRPK